MIPIQTNLLAVLLALQWSEASLPQELGALHAKLLALPPAMLVLATVLGLGWSRLRLGRVPVLEQPVRTFAPEQEPRHPSVRCQALGGLVRLLESLATKLRPHRGNLEQRVGEKTQELLEKNAELERQIADRQLAEASLRESEDRYRRLVQTLHIGITRVSTEHEVLMVNEAMARMLHKSPAELVGAKCFRAFENRECVCGHCPGVKAMATGRVHEAEVRVTCPDRSLLIARVQAVPTYGPDGKPSGFVEVVEDVTERKRAEEALREQSKLLTTVVSNIPHFVFWKDRESVYLGCNANFARVAGVANPADIVGKTDYDLAWKPEETEWYRQCDREVMERDQPWLDIEEHLLQADGKEAVVLTSKVPLHDAAGRVTGILGIYTDITERKRAEAELAAVHQQLLAASRQAGMAEVATSVLHNVGNVLNSVNVSAALAADQSRSSQVSDLVKVADLIRRHSDDLGDFITRDEKGRKLPAYLCMLANHLLQEQTSMIAELDSLAHNLNHVKEIVAQQQTLARGASVVEDTSIVEIAEKALQLSGLTGPQDGITVVREFVERPHMRIDKHKVLQILVNLLRNAKEALLQKGGHDLRVTMRVDTTPQGAVRLVVADNGAGIAGEHLTRVFTHGFTTKTRGHGFGLHGSALLAKELGGSLNVESGGAGLGAAFALELPAQPVEEPL